MSGRFLIRWLSIAVLSGLAAVATALYWRTDIAHFAIIAVAQRYGIPVRALDVSSIGTDGLILKDVRIGEAGGPSAQSIEISWTSETVALGHVARIKIREPRVALTYADGKFSVDGLALPSSDRAGRAPFDRLEISSAKVALTTPWGAGEAVGDARILSAPEGMALARVDLASANMTFSGGTLSLADVVFAPDTPLDARLAVDRVDLEALLALIDVEGLRGSGSISGTIPIHLDPDGVAVSEGRLIALGPGRLGYSGEALPQDLPGADKDASDAVSLARRALADFRYTALTLELNRAATGEGSLLARMEGANPNVLDNQPFVFNIRLNANVDTLAEILLDGYATAGQLLRKASER